MRGRFPVLYPTGPSRGGSAGLSPLLVYAQLLNIKGGNRYSKWLLKATLIER